MRGDFFDTDTVPGFSSTSRHCIPRRSPRNSNSEETPNNGAALRLSLSLGSLGDSPFALRDAPDIFSP